MNCCYNHGEEDICGTSFLIGTLTPSENYSVTVTDQAIDAVYQCDKVADVNGDIEVDVPDDGRARDRVYVVTVKDSSGDDVSFSIGGSSYSCIEYTYIKKQSCE